MFSKFVVQVYRPLTRRMQARPWWALGYIDAISEMIDFRKLHGASGAVFQKFSATELYLKRARKTVAKMMRLQWTQDLDIETLEGRGHWATMEELLEVVKFHLPRYENAAKICKSSQLK